MLATPVILLAVLAIVASVLHIPQVVRAANSPVTKAAPSWQIVSSPNRGTNDDNYLDKVAAVSAHDVWAVGNYLNSNGVNRTLIEHWNGSRWKIVASPNVGVKDNFLNAVAAVSANDIWAAGNTGQSVSPTSPTKTLIEHWNGTSWQVISSPNPNVSGNHLDGLAVVSSNNIWAVGFTFNYSTMADQTLIERWNGNAWSIIPSPNASANYNFLGNVAAVSARNIWAVGTYLNSNKGYSQTLIEHWNGTNWSIVASPNTGDGSNSLCDIATISANNIWTVGSYVYSPKGYSKTLVEHWNGSTWKIVSSPSIGPFNNILYSVAAISASDIWAVGEYNIGGNLLGQTLTEVYR
jgi:hypothetical protein